MNLVKQVRYKASNPIKFRRSKEFFSSFNLVQDFLFSLFYLVLFIQYIIQRPYNSDLFILFNLYTLVTQKGLQVIDSSRVASLKNSFCKVRKVFLILLLQVIIQELIVSVFKDFKLDIVIDAVRRRKVNSLTLLLLTFADLLTNICYTMQCSIVLSGWQRSYRVRKSGQQVRNSL